MSLSDFPYPGNADHAPRRLPSPAPDLDLWWCTLDCTDPALAEFERWLAEGERTRAARYGTEALRRRYVVGRATLRWTLAARLGLAPAAVPIVRGERGRPRLPDPAEALDFNVTHTRGHALIAHLARPGCRVGVDLEHEDRQVAFEGLARKFCTAREQAEDAGLASDARRRAFLRRWTCKEAMAKATGEALGAPLGRMGVSLDPVALVEGPSPYVPAHWALHAIAAPGPFLATVANWSRATPGP